MGIEPSILFGRVMHKRLFPKINAFNYGIYNISIPLSQLNSIPIKLNKFGFLSFYVRDHGYCDGSDLESWARTILKQYSIDKADGEIVLVCMPRVLGYVFNPVSFWLCYDREENLRAVLCEVHNTFGERHTYLCAHGDQSPITEDNVLEGQKLFHVSPFLNREGHYTFRFNPDPESWGVWINYYNADGKMQLVTALNGVLSSMKKANLQKAFWAYPLVTFKAIILIHWQALKLVVKGIKYIPKPLQFHNKTSDARNLTKM